MSYPCKFKDSCSSYKETVYKCTHGGGTACKKWRHFTNRELGNVKPNPLLLPTHMPGAKLK